MVGQEIIWLRTGACANYGADTGNNGLANTPLPYVGISAFVPDCRGAL
jgi:hypothetical protein